MTIQKASEKFNISKSTLYKLCKESQSGSIKYVIATKNGTWNIDDGTVLIMTKEQIRFSLFQILKYKNNPNIKNVSRRTFPEKNVYVIFDYLCCLGFISRRNNESLSLEQCLLNVQLTDEGINSVISTLNEKKMKTINIININNSNNFGCISF